MGEKPTPTWDELVAFAKDFEDAEYKTFAMQVPFKVQVVEESLHFIPSTTREPTSESRSSGEKFLDTLRSGGGSKTIDHTPATVNASYIRAMIDVWRRFST